MKSVKHLCLVLTIAAMPQSGHAFAATNGLFVEPVGGVVFEVSDWRGARAPAYWCAAANFAKRELKAGWKDTLYIVRTKGPSTTTKGSGVQYTIDAAAAGVAPAKKLGSMEVFAVGDNMTLQQANSYCR
ncbi:MAG: hypothetical protein ACI92Z_002388 [Paracoccaceae bacterium]|jgi:hypothetical protein